MGQSSPDPYILTSSDISAQRAHFGVNRDQVEHDFAISQILGAISSIVDTFIFYGGTALSRTFLNGLRLSEDIDLLSVGPRRNTAEAIDRAIVDTLSRHFEDVGGDPPLQSARKDTVACTYRIGSSRVRIQLISGQDYTAWPTQRTQVAMRYAGIEDIEMLTLTSSGFACAKLAAWCDTTRNAPRDLYDLWALTHAGFIDSDAALTFKVIGPTGGFPREWMFPKYPPTQDAWFGSLGHQCIPQVGPDEAFDQVSRAWLQAVTEARALGG